ncbi:MULTISPECIES: hypothetical protein [unclassified Haloferax]|uniref:hypothetical protein n=1 Tax=unclassified Haloferax TaxID=2625095 RepID=UPI000E26E89B|nr:MULTISPECIES: hypothetical protein [unclassified Haloferax]MBC9986730.1 hypothetical protein [Haloferax sp. AS1]RDZ35328.1 hypothetical protein C5B88_13085 [Haloferax sp. Atlit-24N]RLM35739.1 hypothetical protein DVK03_13095 [Haloferax sp. Atlit-109R]RLM43586.1 hypothetical protein DVK04_13095 [Haloferax sp. Atlit-105R]
MEVVRNVRELTAVLEQLTEMTGAVTGVELASGGDSTAAGVSASATVEYDLASECAVDPNRLRVSSPAAAVTDGLLRLELDVTLAPPESGAAEPEPMSSGRAGEDDPEPTASPVARTDGSGTRNSSVDPPVTPGASPPTMESAVPTVRDEAPERDRAAAESADDAVEAAAGADADASRKTATGADADAKTEPETVPAHHDPVRLREAYETCETFKEMTDALGVDVTPQTVRNQMIQRGIHEPDSYGPSSEPASSGGTSDGDDEVRNSEPSVADAEDATESEPAPAPEPSPKPESNAAPDADADAESVALDADETSGAAEEPPTATDLPSLPASLSSLDCSTADVCAAVAGAKTLYEVERRLGLDRAEVREALTALDLLDLVTGRMARRDASAASPADVRTRVCAALDENAE